MFYWILSSMVVYMTFYVIDLRLYHTWRPAWGAPGWVMMLLWAIGLFIAAGGAWIIQDDNATLARPSGWVYTLTLFVVVLGMLFVWPFAATAANDDSRLWVAWAAAAWLLIATGLELWVMIKSTVSYSTTGGWLMFPLEIIMIYFVSVAFGGAYRMTYGEPRELTEDGYDVDEYGFYDRQRDNAYRDERMQRRRNRNRETGSHRTNKKKKNNVSRSTASTYSRKTSGYQRGGDYDSQIEFAS